MNGDGGTPAGTGPSPGGRDAGSDVKPDAGRSAPDAGRAVIKRALQLTFDDGPTPVASALAPILKEVAARNVTAAFFVLGYHVKDHHSAIAMIRKAGHVIGNHSWDHMEAGTEKYTDDAIYDQFERTHAEVKKAGVVMEHWRVPRGEFQKRIAAIITGTGPRGAPDAGRGAPDAGRGAPDAGRGAPDAGRGAPDAGRGAPDAGRGMPDAGRGMPDAGRGAPPRKQLYSKSHCDWQADSRDAKGSKSAEDMLRSIEQDFANTGNPPLHIGNVRVWRLLFHVKPSTASALKDVLDELQRRGGKFVDFSQDS